MTDTKEAQAFFDHFGGGKVTWIGRWLTVGLCHKILRFVQPGPRAKILEIGPGRGDFARLCLEKNLSYCAIEANRRMAAQLEAAGVKVYTALVPPLPALEETFDIVVIVNVMEHMNSMQDALAVVSQIHAQLQPGARLLICCPDYLNWGNDFYHCDFSHNYVTTQRRLAQLLTNGGFTQVKSLYVSGPFEGILAILFSMFVRWLPFRSGHAWFPKNRFLAKLYSLKLGLLRKVVVIGLKE